MIEVPTRRGLLLGLGAMLAAPAVVKAASLMKISAPRLLFFPIDYNARILIPYFNIQELHLEAGGLNYMSTATEIRALEQQALKRLSNVLGPINNAFENLAIRSLDTITFSQGD